VLIPNINDLNSFWMGFLELFSALIYKTKKVLQQKRKFFVII